MMSATVLLLSGLVGAAAAAGETWLSASTFVEQALLSCDERTWIIAEGSDEALFVVVDDDWCSASESLSVVLYARPQTIGRYCMSLDGRLRSRQSSREFLAKSVRPAPLWRELVTSIETDPRRCLPSSERGLLFETIELLCFGLGYKPSVVRQRQATGGGAASNALVNGAPAALFTPHTHGLLTHLLGREDVWIGESKNEWTINGETLYEESIVIARHAAIGRRLVDLKAQDASVPGQKDDRTKALFIVEVGSLLGYPKEDIKKYILKDMLPGYPSINEALRQGEQMAQRVRNDDDTPSAAQFVVGASKMTELEQFKTSIIGDHDSAVPLDPTPLLDIARSLDFAFHIRPSSHILSNRTT